MRGIDGVVIPSAARFSTGISAQTVAMLLPEGYLGLDIIVRLEETYWITSL
jgi:hypothetical protein